MPDGGLRAPRARERQAGGVHPPRRLQSRPARPDSTQTRARPSRRMLKTKAVSAATAAGGGCPVLRKDSSGNSGNTSSRVLRRQGSRSGGEGGGGMPARGAGGAPPPHQIAVAARAAPAPARPPAPPDAPLRPRPVRDPSHVSGPRGPGRHAVARPGASHSHLAPPPRRRHAGVPSLIWRDIAKPWGRTHHQRDLVACLRPRDQVGFRFPCWAKSHVKSPNYRLCPLFKSRDQATGPLSPLLRACGGQRTR
jgi:hypothetical protein